MKRVTITLVLISFFSHAQLPQNEENSLCNIGFTNPWIAPSSGSTNNLIKNSDPTYVEAGLPLTIKAKQEYWWDSSGALGLPEYKTSRHFAFYKADILSSYPSLLQDFSHNENYSMVFAARGSYRVIVAATDETRDKILWSGPYGDPMYDPYCDAIEVISQNKPTGNIITLEGGGQVNVSINASIDLLSKNASNNIPPIITYTFYNESYSKTEKVVTESKIINFFPQYNGVINVSITINDGALNKTIVGGSVGYTGGIACTTCGQVY